MKGGSEPVWRDVVLIGGGHSHVGVIKSFGMRPMAGVRVTVICTDTDTPYSGMLPGYVAGHYDFDDIHIDLRRLAEHSGVRYLLDEAIGIDRAERRVLCRSRAPVRYDVVSIDIGSTPKLAEVPGAADYAIPVKPIRGFNRRWLALLERVRDVGGPIAIAVVGAGAAGVEMTLAMQFRLRRELVALGRNPDDVRFHLFAAGEHVLPSHNVPVRRVFEDVLRRRGVTVHRSAPVSRLEPGRLVTRAGEIVQADEILWVTQAGGAPWLRDTGLELDERGFVRVGDTLQSASDPRVFAVGDCASMIGHELEKAGVYAVRMSRPLTENLRRGIAGVPLVRYRPQRRFLALLSTGDRYAVASRGWLFARGHWVWRWKDRIDRRFMRMFRELEPMAHGEPAPAEFADAPEAERSQADAAVRMRCGGCGAKVGAGVLARVLTRIRPLHRPDVPVGFDQADDAAIVRVPPGKAIVHSVDFFRAFVDDPWLFGRIAANHALGDLYAMGAEPQFASAVATVPPGLERQVEETVFQLMAGAVSVLNEAGCALVGGHTGEGTELALGFAVNGLVGEGLSGVLRKSGLRPGDAIVLTKPLGTGTLLAAHARLAARGRWIDAALASMQVSNRAAAACLIAHGAAACTDVTGFGLIGHFLEMTAASAVGAELRLDAIPVLDGAVETVAAGWVSSLHAANAQRRSSLAVDETAQRHARFPLLFDPQTAGGLLAGIPDERAEACIAELVALGYSGASIVGRVRAACDGRPMIECVAGRHRRPGSSTVDRNSIRRLSGVD